MIYFDNAATTFPKPRQVVEAANSVFKQYGANPGRSGHKMSMDTAVKVYECREAAAGLFHAQVQDVVFACNCTHALNMAIKGCLRQRDHVIISDLEHNSILRPIHALASQGAISYSVAQVGGNDEETVAAFERLITPSTRLIACIHGSNIFGLRLPIAQIGAMAKRHGLLFLVDAAQTAGVVDINMARDNIDFLCTAGHKSLYGPSGTGLLITPHVGKMATLMEGGTGSFSSDPNMPYDSPDRMESGTANTVGILGLAAGIGYVREKGVARIYAHEMQIGAEIFAQLKKINGVRLYTDNFQKGVHLPVIAFNVDGIPSEEVIEALSEMGFALRGGLHCAPLAHRKMGTLETGAARISIGAFNTLEQGKRLCAAIGQVAAKKK